MDTVRKDDDDDDENDGDEFVVQRRVINEVPLSGPISDIPEFHDCQRLIVDSAGREVYGSLYAIFARNRLNDLESRIDSLQDSVVYPQYKDSIAAVPGATIYAYGDKYDPGRYDKGYYGTLKLTPGFNCLYFWKWKQMGQWRAWMVNKGPDDPVCPEPLVIKPIEAAANELRVSRIMPDSGLQGADVPPVARWDWDFSDGEQFIGIQCGGAWCEVSDDGTQSPQPAIPDLQFKSNRPPWAQTPRLWKRVSGIRGWYDAQRLAQRSAGGRATPSDVWGVVVPHPTLFAETMATYKEWKHVATAIVSADYHGAVLTLKSGQQNDIYLCDGARCVPTQKRPKCKAPPDAERMVWMMVVTGTDTSYHCGVRRTPAGSQRVPGTARWRWLANDEGTWKRCEEGCCEIL